MSDNGSSTITTDEAKMTAIEGDDDSYDEIDKKWRKIWRNANGQRHRDGGKPAVIWADGSEAYYKDGKIHRDGDLPAVIWADGSEEYWVNGAKQK